jgi:Fe/S biogenesis protein NfuA
MITFTGKAKDKILELLAAEDQKDLALRIAIPGRARAGWQYQLQFVAPDEKDPDDIVVDGGGFQVYIDPESAPNLEGATVDYVERGPIPGADSGFKIENPNPIWKDPKAQAVQEVLDTRINPGVAMHGGNVMLLDVKDDIAYIALGGGCQGCGMADVTLRQGIEVMIKEAVPEIREIIDTTDHAAGRNPFYQPSKGGGPSPLA